MISAWSRKQLAKKQMIFKSKSPTHKCDLYPYTVVAGLWTNLSPINLLQTTSGRQFVIVQVLLLVEVMLIWASGPFFLFSLKITWMTVSNVPIPSALNEISGACLNHEEPDQGSSKGCKQERQLDCDMQHTGYQASARLPSELAP